MRLMVGAASQQELDLGIEAGAGTIDDGLGEIAYDLSDMRRYERVTFSLPLGYYRNLAAMRASPTRIEDPRPLRFMTPETAEAVRVSLRRQFAQEPATLRELQYGALVANFAALHGAGARIVIASDSGSQGQFHTDAIWNEMGAWHAAGVSIADTLRAATSIPAALLGEPDIGRLVRGARADLVLYLGDIRDGAFDAARVVTVVKAGNILIERGLLTTAALRPDPSIWALQD